MPEPRSRCPISLTLDLLGDRWSLLIVRDLMFTERRGFNELKSSEEGISSNVLADRLERLLAAGIVDRGADPNHRQKVTYRLTEAGIDLLPVIAELGIWGRHHRPVTPSSEAQARSIEAGGPELRRELRAQLRAAHAPSAASAP